MFTGSGMPMRFADTDGTMIDVYQATTQMTDESNQTYPYTVDTLLDRALGPEGYYGVFTANMHTDTVESAGSDAIVASALQRGVPVVSGRQLLTWLDARNQSSFQSLEWSDDTLSFTIDAPVDARGLQALVPTSSGVGTLSEITRDGSSVAMSTKTIKGIEYAVFTAEAGSYDATYEVDSTPPTISNVTAVPRANGTSATISWSTNESAVSRVDYGTSASTLDRSVTGAALVTSHSVVLSGLAPSTTFHFRVTSADGFGNEVTSPPSEDVPLSFSTPAGGDQTPPAVVDRSPESGSTGVPRGASVGATFSEPMNAASFTSATVRLRAAGAADDVPATVAYGGARR